MDNTLKISFKEFVALMAIMISLTALSLDAMLPALTVIGDDLGVTEANDNQLIISTLFLGLGLGQLLYGPLSDSLGRKPAVYLGLIIFTIGCIISIVTNNFTTMLIGRCLQGIGVAGPRIISVAIIRDLYKGDQMAQVMSFVMAVFISAPALAPAIGQGVMYVSHWRYIFIILLLLALIIFIWFSIRQQETLTPENRIVFSVKNLKKAFKEVLSIRTTMLYTLAAGFITASFIGMLNSSQQVFQIQYKLGEQFPLYFSSIALSIGLASFINGKLVMRFGMQTMAKTASISIFIFSAIFLTFLYTASTTPSLQEFMLYLLPTVFSVGILFGNLNSMAMEPLGHIAGLGSAVVGCLSTLISIPFGTYIGMQYNGTVNPLVMGFLVFGGLCSLSLLIVRRWT